MGGEDDDGGYSALAPSVRRRIDDAFDSATLSSSPSSSPPSPKRRKLDRDHTSPHPASSLSVTVSKSNQVLSGGFLLDDPSPAASGFLHHDDSLPPGGFLPEPSISQHSDPGQDDAPTHIPLSFIPTALRVLNLQPDDDVLSVFRNAASGWNHGPTWDGPQDDLVSRRDWRAVCAALLDTGLAHDDVDIALSSTSDGVVANMEEPSDSGEEYTQPRSDSDMEEDQDSDDDYHESGFLRSKCPARKPTSKAVSESGRGRRPGAVSSEDGSETSETEGGLNAQQKKECRAAFALFFPDVRDELLDEMRIRIKDITRIAALIKEKLSAEEVVEMLEAFSSSSDKSVGLDEFEQMMVATKLV